MNINFTLIRLLIGFPSFLIGVGVSSFGGWFFYVLGCVIALFGSYHISKCLKHNAEGLGWLLIGFPIFLFSMKPEAYNFLYFFEVKDMTVNLSRIISSFMGAICIFVSFNKP